MRYELIIFDCDGVLVEDSLPGILAARSAGMDAFAYLGGVTPHERSGCQV